MCSRFSWSVALVVVLCLMSASSERKDVIVVMSVVVTEDLGRLGSTSTLRYDSQ